MTNESPYILISADSHAGADHATYREYLESTWHEEFDAWRGRYKNPYRDLVDDGRTRNWDNERRITETRQDGTVGEVLFPNTVPPFFPSAAVLAGPPRGEDFEKRLAGIRAHNRWLKDFCSDAPAQRAGVAQIFLNDVDEAVADVTWVKENGLRGGILLPNLAPDVKWVKPLYDPGYDRLWEVCEDLGVPVNSHAGTGLPDYGRYRTASMLYINEVGFYSMRPLVQMILSGVFERFPKLKFAVSEQGCAWAPDLMRQLDTVDLRVKRTGRIGELFYSEDEQLPLRPSEYFRRNVWVGATMPSAQDMASRDTLGEGKFMWGSDYPHNEGTYPFTRECIRQVMHDVEETELRKLFAENAAELYDFDLDALAPLAVKYGPTPSEVARPLTELPENPNDVLLRESFALQLEAELSA
ncbi:amidohydrolase family protein [Rhodococcus triatomae]|nr:amidase [Rhodococcus triatomae BKS 15-14]